MIAFKTPVSDQHCDVGTTNKKRDKVSKQSKEILFPPVRHQHCVQEVWMEGLQVEGQPPSAQNRLLCPQPATGG